jgi:hypothetical protein
MKRTLFLIAIGAAAGYSWGFADARTHDQDIVHRMVARVAGKPLGQVGNNVDGAMERLEKK